MQVNAIREHIATVYRAGERYTSLLIGPPGIGKSAIVRQAADALGIECRVTPPLPTLEPVDIAGMYDVLRDASGDPAKTRAVRVPFADIVPTEGAGLLVIDDVTTAVPATQASIYGLVHERRVGSTQVGDGWMIVCTANRDDDAAATHRMPSPLTSRMEWLDAEVDPSGWEGYMAEHARSPLVRAFIRATPQSLMDFDPERPGPFPCPRSWEYVAITVDAYERVGAGMPPEAAIAGRVGAAHALQFIAFARSNALLVPPADVLADPDKAPIPPSLSALVVLMTALANAVRDETMDALVRYLKRIEAGELRIYCMKGALAADTGRRKAAEATGAKAPPSIIQTPAFTSFALAHEELLRVAPAKRQ